MNQAIKHLKKDPKLAKLIDKVGQYKIKLIKNKYEALVESIITQQLSSRAAQSISKKFRQIYGRFPEPDEVLRTHNTKLRAAGISKMKVSYIKGLSKKIHQGILDLDALEQMTDEQIISELTKVRGIGRWTAEMFLIFCLGRQDVFAVDDLGLRKGIQKMYSLQSMPQKDEIHRLTQRWSPFRTVASWYIWKATASFDKIG